MYLYRKPIIFFDMCKFTILTHPTQLTKLDSLDENFQLITHLSIYMSDYVSIVNEKNHSLPNITCT